MVAATRVSCDLADPMTVEFRIYSRDGCHLCECMERELRAVLAGIPAGVSIIDVDSDPDLQDRFGEWVPVLVAGDRELCHYHLNPDRVREYLNQFG